MKKPEKSDFDLEKAETELKMRIAKQLGPEKIEAISPFMNVTNLVLRKDYSAFVRKYEVVPEEML